VGESCQPGFSFRRAGEESHVADHRTAWIIAAVLIGAVIGFFFALLAELTGHPSWAVLMLLLCSLAPSSLIAFGDGRLPGLFGRLRRQPVWVRFGLAALSVLLSFGVMEALGINPRGYAYVPLVAPVILSALFLGFGPGLFAVVFATLWADFRYALPEYDFAITEWEDAAGLATFAILGALIAFIIQEFVSLGE
jgi:hypothetical protein